MENMDLQNKILNAVLDVQESVNGLDERMVRVEGVQNNMYDKIDGFLNLINRHEAEISSLRSKYERLEERIEKLDLKNT